MALPLQSASVLSRQVEATFRPSALVRGTFERHAFPALLVGALERRSTGTLVLEEPSGERHGLYFESGEPCRAKVVSPGFFLGEVLIDQGKMTRQLHRATLERAIGEGALYGQLLLENGFVSGRTLAAGLREQLVRQVAWLFGRSRRTRFAYFQGRNLLSRWGRGPTHARSLEILWRGVRDHLPLSEIEAGLERVGGRPLALRSGFPQDHFAFLGGAERAVELLAARPRGLDELRACEPSLDCSVPRLVYFLMLTRSLELGVGGGPPLGAEPSAFDAGPRRADGCPGLSSDPALRAAHLAAVGAGRGTKKEYCASADAPFRRAELCLKRGELGPARREVAHALRLEPERPEFIALGAWLSTTGPEPDFERIAEDVRRARRTGTGNPLVEWYTGLVLRRLGRENAALRAFRAVVEHDPEHVDALRELRLSAERRRAGADASPGAAGAPSAWRWLFGKR